MTSTSSEGWKITHGNGENVNELSLALFFSLLEFTLQYMVVHTYSKSFHSLRYYCSRNVVTELIRIICNEKKKFFFKFSLPNLVLKKKESECKKKLFDIEYTLDLCYVASEWSCSFSGRCTILYLPHGR